MDKENPEKERKGARLFLMSHDYTYGSQEREVYFDIFAKMVGDLEEIRNLREYCGIKIEVDRIEIMGISRGYRVKLKQSVESEPGVVRRWLDIDGEDIDTERYKDPNAPWIRPHV